MTQCYAYIRVSTVKQGERGVSLQEQRSAIELYAQRREIQISEWFEERVTAAKMGRPLFTRMLKQLRNGEAAGVLIHKIDRSARNLRDWAELGELIDAGVAVHFANESVDLLSRGGRLSADIQAVVAADYIRNLREEAVKGLRGRLKQGFYPFAAPLGYLNTGSGKVKEVDTSRAPLIREMFELYASGRHSVDSLVEEIYRRGLRNSRQKKVNRACLASMLNNVFYAGLTRLRHTGETFPGKHTPLVPMALFQEVKARLSGRFRSQGWTHDFTLRGLFRCSLCNKLLIAETQKGHVYYRCHTKTCPTKGFREEILEQAMLGAWPSFALADDEKARLTQQIEYVAGQEQKIEGDRTTLLQAQLANLKTRRARLVDVFVDGGIDKPTFDERTRSLLEEEKLTEDALNEEGSETDRTKAMLLEVLELAGSPQQSYLLASPASRRELAKRLSSNLSVAGKEVSVEPYYPLVLLGKCVNPEKCGHHRTATRTFVQGEEMNALHRTATQGSVKSVWKLWSWAERWLDREGGAGATRRSPPTTLPRTDTPTPRHIRPSPPRRMGTSLAFPDEEGCFI
ncbi:MAG: recombinase family protein [Dehalococcoidia bacterium]|nr:recombinase family protein [Dehalococcoidia bacterium]